MREPAHIRGKYGCIQAIVQRCGCRLLCLTFGRPAIVLLNPPAFLPHRIGAAQTLKYWPHLPTDAYEAMAIEVGAPKAKGLGPFYFFYSKQRRDGVVVQRKTPDISRFSRPCPDGRQKGIEPCRGALVYASRRVLGAHFGSRSRRWRELV